MKKFVLALSAIAAIGLAAVAYAGLRPASAADEAVATLAKEIAQPTSDAKPATAEKSGCCSPKTDAATVAKPAAKGGCCCGAKSDPTQVVKADAPKPDEKPAAKEEKTLTGTMACAKCGLKMAGIKKCTNAIQVKDGDKTVVYLLDDKGNGEDYHEGLCGGGTKENAKVTGTITEKDGQKTIKPSKVEAK